MATTTTMKRSRHHDMSSTVMVDNSLRQLSAASESVIAATSGASGCATKEAPAEEAIIIESIVGKQTTAPMSSSINDYLIKLTMFLMTTIVCSHNILMRPVNCQKHSFQHQHHHHHHQASANNYPHSTQYHPRQQQHQPQPQHYHHQQLVTSHEHILLDQRQALDHLMRSNHHHHHHHFVEQNADRRASAAAAAGSPNGSGGSAASQQLDGDDTGKLLVCYYTTRQSAPYWPAANDARGYAETTGGDGGPAEPRQESGFAPMLQYEPFVSRDRELQPQLQQQQQQVGGSMAEFGFGDGSGAGSIKNQQQQLLFKSAAVMHQPSTNNQPIAAGYGGRSGGLQQQQQQGSARQVNNKYQELFASTEQQVAFSPQQQQSLVMASGGAGFSGHNASLMKGKQTPAHSFIGADGIDNNIGGSATSAAANNGLIMSMAAGGGGGVTSFASAGNNGFIISNKDASGSASNNNNNNNGANSHLERSLLKQQQSVFSPPPQLSRAFIVGGSVGVGGGPDASPNNEVSLDTKSQLFIPSAKQQQQQQHNNNYYVQQQQQTAVSSHPNGLYQQQQQQQQLEMPLAGLKPGKSLQVSATDSKQLSPVSHSAHSGAGAFSGAVSNAPPVPLSPATASQQAGYLGRNSQLHSPASFLPSVIVGGSNSVQQQQQQQQQAANAPQSTKTHSLANNSIGGTNLSTMKLSYSAAAASDSSSGVKSSSSIITNANQALTASQQQQVLSTSSAAAAGGSTTSTGGGSSASTALLHLPTASASSLAPSAATAAAASPSSSPLSTMFDVFGAASQYLMRFKPSSLISPSSFVFNAINSNHHALADHSVASAGGQPQHGIRPANSSSSLLGSLAAASSGSLIPLPFSSSLMASLQKSASAASSAAAAANDRSSSSSSSSGGSILSRFSLSQSNQRREDVCGRTIQTPQRRIIGGEGARYGEFPYQVHIKIAKHQCGGALVDKQSIVTAAHCVYHFITRAPVSKLQIVIGAYDIEDEQYQELPPQYFKVNKVKLHPNFRFSASHPDRYDIAILKLDKPVKYTDNVLPVCLPGKDLKFESMVGTVTGFGKTDPSLSNRYGTRLLQKVDVPIIENNECERWHRTRGIDLKIFPEMMCAGYEDGLKDACVGDSGGPLVVKTSSGAGGGARWTLAGITSAGFGCAQSRQPGIYHRVSHTVDWILENLD